MFFVGPVWLCILLPVLLAPIPLGTSLVIRQRRAPAVAPMALAAAGLAIAAVLGGAPFAAALTVSVLVTHWAGRRIAAAVDEANPRGGSARSRATTWLSLAVLAQIALAAAMMRGPLVGDPLRQVGGMLLPFGVSYFAFHGISYLVSVYRRRSAPEENPVRLSLYLILLPQIVAGPVDFHAAAPQLARRLASISDYSFGVRRLVIGVWKVFVMAAFAGAQADVVFAVRPDRLTTLAAWVGLASVTIQTYYAFSGYADMAIGVARMFGIRLPENFRWPLAADSVREFWRRWHIGLSGWFRTHAGASSDTSSSIADEVLGALICGAWYGIGWTFVFWGSYHALWIAAERAGLEAAMKRLPAVVRHGYLVLAVSPGFLLLRSATLADAWTRVCALIGANASSGRSAPLTFGDDVWLLLAAGAIGCAPLSPMVRRWTVTIDALIVSGLMALIASVLFTWRGVRMVAAVFNSSSRR